MSAAAWPRKRSTEPGRGEVAGLRGADSACNKSVMHRARCEPAGAEGEPLDQGEFGELSQCRPLPASRPVCAPSLKIALLRRQGDKSGGQPAGRQSRHPVIHRSAARRNVKGGIT